MMEGEVDDQALDVPHEADFLLFYRKLPNKSSTTIRLFDRKDFFTIHGPDADFIASDILKTQTVIKYIDSIPSIALSINKLEMILKELLLIRHYRIEIYKKEKSSKHANWSLDVKASPGNLGSLEDTLYSVNDNTSGLISVKIVGNDVPTIGVAYINTLERIVSVIQFADDQYLSVFEAILVQCAPKEVIIPKSFRSSAFFRRFEEIMDLNKILVTDVKAQSYVDDFSSLKPQLAKILSSKIKTDYLEEHKLTVAAFSAAIDYLNLTTSDTDGRYSLQKFDVSFVRLDSSAIKSLDLFTVNGSDSSINNNFSVYHLLNHCRTLAGQRLLVQWIRQPLTDLNHIQERLDLVDFFRDHGEIRKTLNSVHLRRVPDLLRLSKKFEAEKASLFDCCKVYDFVKCLPSIRDLLESSDDAKIKDTFVDLFSTSEQHFEPFIDLIKSTVDFNRLDENHEPMIKADFDEELGKIYEELQEVENDAEKLATSIARKFDLDSTKLKIERNSQTGYNFRVTKKEEKNVRNGQGIRFIDRTKKDAIRFSNSKLDDLSNKYVELMAAYENQQKELVSNVIKVAATYSEAMRTLGDVVAKLDVLVSFALYSCSGKKFVRPKLLPKGTGKIIISQVRHPCLEAQPDAIFVPNDVNLDESEHKFYLVTGPNMGGKSTYIRSVAISVLLAHIGSYVPADSATISLVDGIQTRVGSSDYQLKGVSTFMAEMIETSSILRGATKDSLIIIDELGRGTSTYDGFGLSWHISEYIATKIKAYCFFATHFHELTALTKTVPAIGNLSVKAETTDNGLIFLYKVDRGICDQSFGIHVARLAQFPEHIIADASKKVQELEGFSGIDEKTRKLRQYVIEYVKKIDVDNSDDNEIADKISQLREYIKNQTVNGNDS